MRRLIVSLIAVALLTGSGGAALAQSATGVVPDMSGIIPKPANSVPPSEASTPAVGAQTMRYALEDHVHSRITRAVNCTTVAAGTCTVTYSALSTVPSIFPIPFVSSTSATQAPLCFPVSGTVTTTSATVKCFTTQTVTVSILGATVAPLTTAAAGVTVQVLAIPLS